MFRFDALKQPQMQWSNFLPFIVIQELFQFGSKIFSLLKIHFCKDFVHFLSFIEFFAFNRRCGSDDLSSLEQEQLSCDFIEQDTLDLVSTLNDLE